MRARETSALSRASFGVYILALLLLPRPHISIAHAEWISPEKTHASTDRFDGVNVRFEPGVYSYDISWQSIPVGSAAITLRRLSSGEAHIAVRVQTARGVRWLYSLKHVSEALFETTPFKPVRFSSRQLENSRAKYRAVNYLADGTIRARDWKPGKKGDTFTLNTKNLTLDPIAAAFLAINLPADIGTTAVFDVFNGKHRFIITMRVESHERLSSLGRMVDTMKVVPTIQKLTDTEGEKRFKGAALWFTPGESKQIVRLSSKVWIGSIVAELVKYDSIVPSEPLDHIRARIAAPDRQPSFE